MTITSTEQNLTMYGVRVVKVPSKNLGYWRYNTNKEGEFLSKSMSAGYFYTTRSAASRLKNKFESCGDGIAEVIEVDVIEKVK